MVEDKHALVEELATRHGQGLRRFLRSRVRNAGGKPSGATPGLFVPRQPRPH